MKKISIYVFLTAVFCFTSCTTFGKELASGTITGGAIIADMFLGGTGSVSDIGAGVGSAIMATEDFLPEPSYYLGRSVGAIIVSQYGADFSDMDKILYLNNICWTLQVNSPEIVPFKGYHVLILDTDEINSFATPGGHIFISRGILNSLKSEDEIAAVIAHEMSHIQLEHGTRAIKQNRWGEAGASILSGTIGLVSGDDSSKAFADTVAGSANTLISSGYSKDWEYEADKNAVLLLYQSGYSPDALVSALSDLEKNPEYSKGGLTNTHPTPKNRIKKVKKQVEKYPSVQIPPNRESRYKKYF